LWKKGKLKKYRYWLFGVHSLY